MPKIAPCPHPADLRKLASGDLPARDIEPIIEHLETCVSCLRQVQTLPASDPLIAQLAQAQALPDGPDEEMVSLLIERLKRLATASESPARPAAQPGPQGASDRETAPPVDQSEESTVLPRDAPAWKGASVCPQAGRETGAEDPVGGAGNEVLWDFLAPTEAPDEIGRLGQFRVLKVLGAGGMGVVFQAEDPHLKRLVALKAMLPAMAASPSAKQRFLREARAAAGIKHDHIVTIHQVGEDRGAPFLAMEFLEGEPLDVRLHRENKSPLNEVLRIGREVAEGLAAAHERNLIHRDIKPGNIWLEAPKNRVKILDFGLARSTSHGEINLTQQGVIVGTPAFMAPEQACGGTVDHRCDLFSLGCVLYRMATGELPFKGKDTMSILSSLALDMPKPPRELNPVLPPALSDLILKLLAKQPDDRPASATVVAAALLAIQRELAKAKKRQAPAAEPKPGIRPQTAPDRKKARRWPLVAAGLLLLAGVAAAGIVLWLKVPGGVVKLEVEPTDAQVEVVEGKITVSRPGDGQPWRIELAQGKGQLKISKAGFVLQTREVTLGEKGQTIRVELKPEPLPALTSAPDLSKARLLYRDTFDDPRSGWFGPRADSNYGYNGGRYFIQPKNGGTYGINCPRRDFVEDFACQVEGRVTGDADSAWGLSVHTKDKHDIVRGFQVMLTREGSFQVQPSFWQKGENRTPQVGPLRHEAIKAGDAVNVLLVVVRGRRVEIYVNGIAMGDPLVLDRDVIPARFSLLARGSKETRAEYERFTVWSTQEYSPVGPQVSGPLPKKFTNARGMEFVLVPKGKSWLGGGGGKPGDKEVEIAHDFYLGVYEVTQEEWELVTGLKPSHFSRTGAGKDAVKDIPDADLKRFPVENVSRDDAQLFLARLNERDKQAGWVYRLPTQAEWEYACRGGPGDKLDGAFDFYFDKPTNQLLPGQANYKHDKSLNRTCKVGSYAPNQLGLYDMHGNVWEWCDDDLPGGGVVNAVVRGGCWTLEPSFCRAAQPYGTGRSISNEADGLRLARVPVGNEGK